MKRIFFIVSLILLVCTASLPLSAKVRLPRLVSNKMVLQRDTELKNMGLGFSRRESNRTFSWKAL